MIFYHKHKEIKTYKLRRCKKTKIPLCSYNPNDVCFAVIEKRKSQFDQLLSTKQQIEGVFNFKVNQLKKRN